MTQSQALIRATRIISFIIIAFVPVALITLNDPLLRPLISGALLCAVAALGLSLKNRHDQANAALGICLALFAFQDALSLTSSLSNASANVYIIAVTMFAITINITMAPHPVGVINTLLILTYDSVIWYSNPAKAVAPVTNIVSTWIVGIMLIVVNYAIRESYRISMQQTQQAEQAKTAAQSAQLTAERLARQAEQDQIATQTAQLAAERIAREAEQGQLAAERASHEAQAAQLAAERIAREAEQGQLAAERLARQAEQERGAAQTAQFVAERIARYNESLLSAVNHEFRTPLNVIMTTLEMLLMVEYFTFEDEVTDSLKNIQRNAKRLADMINNFLDLASTNAGKPRMNYEIVDPRTMINDMLADLSPHITSRQLYIKTDLASDLTSIVTDKAKLDAVLSNLLRNAQKFTDSGGITIESGSDQDEWWFQVKDTGIGIDPESLAHIWETFYQVESGDNRSRQGSGLGLAIAKSNVDLLSGRIDVKSTPGQGTVFTVRLPLKPPPIPKEEI